jgi:hypothetical protein
MTAMQPVFHFLNGLEGFDWAAFWIAGFTCTMLAGFFVDYVMQKQGFGPYFNSLFVLGGVWAGLYLRFNYLQPNRLHFYDPYLTLTAIFGVTATMFIVLAFVRNRAS